MALLKLPRSTHSFYISLAVVLCVGTGAGYALAVFLGGSPSDSGNTITREGGYQYVNPLLSCDIGEDVEYLGFRDLAQKLGNASQTFIANGKAKRVSIYFRDMNYGEWTGVNVDDTYIPASLLKVPLAIAFYREFQQDPALANTLVSLPSGDNLNGREEFQSKNVLPQGHTYSITDLLSALLKGSDNNASDVLNALVATSTLNDVYAQVGLPGIATDLSQTMSPKSFMRAFRILFNASYLSRGNSQSILQSLSQGDFSAGIVSGVPQGMPVAHKFGERTVSSVNSSTGTVSVDTRELHDCGIVYYPKHPYGICIMTEGNSFSDLESVIASLSKTAYVSVNEGLLSNVR